VIDAGWYESCTAFGLAPEAQEETPLSNDKAFAIYALTIFAGIASVVTASLMAGSATLPSPLGVLEHLAMSFGFRAAYKGFGGFSWDDWSLLGDAGERSVATATPSGFTADATS
jgi:hypothetical protein